MEIGRKRVEIGRKGVEIARNGMELGRNGGEIARNRVEMDRNGLEIDRDGGEIDRDGVEIMRVGGGPRNREEPKNEGLTPHAGPVGEFVPFYFCPRSPMLYAINLGNTGRPPGCQTTIVHLVSRVRDTVGLGVPWAVSDGNAGAFHTTFESTLQAIDNLDWKAIEASFWAENRHQKQAEFLVADFFPWTGIHEVGCQNQGVADEVTRLLANQNHRPKVSVRTGWYY